MQCVIQTLYLRGYYCEWGKDITALCVKLTILEGALGILIGEGEGGGRSPSCIYHTIIIHGIYKRGLKSHTNREVGITNL